MHVLKFTIYIIMACIGASGFVGAVNTTLDSAVGVTQTDECYWTGWTDFGDCVDGLRKRVKYCICNDELSHNSAMCPPVDDVKDELNCGQNKLEELVGTACEWVWDYWSTCSKPCGLTVIGNTTRTQGCWCNKKRQTNLTLCGNSGPLSETAHCNVFACDGVKPLNDNYWMDSQTNWPFSKETQFICSQPNTFLSSKTWLEILQDNTYLNFTVWHLLAKEYITARLNHANGFVFHGAAGVIEDAQYLLYACTEFNGSQQVLANTLKDKLLGMNNAIIGGSSQMSKGYGKLNGGAGKIETKNTQTPIVVVAISFFICLLVIFIVAGIVFIRRRYDHSEIIEKDSFYSSDDDSLQRDDRSAEELRL